MKSQLQNLVDHLAAIHRPKRELERRLAEIGLGVLASVQKGQMNFDQARHDLLNLDNYIAIRRRRLSPGLIEFFQWGMQLEDVAEIAPDGLPESYSAMAKLAHKIIQSSWSTGARGTKAVARLRKSA